LQNFRRSKEQKRIGWEQTVEIQNNTTFLPSSLKNVALKRTARYAVASQDIILTGTLGSYLTDILLFTELTLKHIDETRLELSGGEIELVQAQKRVYSCHLAAYGAAMQLRVR
jgi:hypothetical protein